MLSMKLMAIDDNLWLVYTEKLLSMVFLCIFRKYNQQNNMKCGSIANNPIIQTINIFMAFIKKNFLYHASTMCVAESSASPSLRILGVFVIHPTQRRSFK